MIAYKGFNEDLACTRGHGTFRYQLGKTYKEKEAQCANTGFHCVEEPIEVMRWYPGRNDRYCIVEAAGDVHEDGYEKISCTEITLLKEITREQLGILECQWMMKHPDRIYSNLVKKDYGHAYKDEIVVVRGKNPVGAGKIGATIFLLKEGKGSKEIIEAGVFKIDNVNYFEDKKYDVKGRVVSEKRRTEKASKTSGN